MKVGSALAVSAVLVALASSAFAASTITVHVYDFDFSLNPSGQPVIDPTIQLGDTIHWIWDDAFHSVTSVPGLSESWDSGVLLSSNVTFDHTFTHPGEFPYFCLVHGSVDDEGQTSGMAGVITVIPEPASAGVFFLATSVLVCRRRFHM